MIGWFLTPWRPRPRNGLARTRMVSRSATRYTERSRDSWPWVMQELRAQYGVDDSTGQAQLEERLTAGVLAGKQKSLLLAEPWRLAGVRHEVLLKYLRWA